MEANPKKMGKDDMLSWIDLDQLYLSISETVKKKTLFLKGSGNPEYMTLNILVKIWIVTWLTSTVGIDQVSVVKYSISSQVTVTTGPSGVTTFLCSHHHLHFSQEIILICKVWHIQ